MSTSFPKLVAALSATALTLLSSPVLSASASALPPYESRLSVEFTVSDTGIGSARSITFTAVISDSQGELVANSQNPAGSQIQVAGMDVYSCQAEPPESRVAGWTFPQGCLYALVAAPQSGSGAQITISETYSGSALTNFLARRATHPIDVPLVGLVDGSGNDMLLLFGSSGSLPVPAESAVTPETDPGVSFAGPLIASASGRSVDEDTAGTLIFTGKRLHQVTGATIGGIAVTVTSAARSALVIDFDALPAGKHDVVLTTKAGAKTTLRGFMIVN